MNPCNIPRFQLGEDFILETRPLIDMGVSVRTIIPQMGSSVSILSNIYSMLNGFETVFFVGALSYEVPPLLDELFRLAASEQRSVNSAIELTRCCRSVTIDIVDPERSGEQYGTSRKLYVGWRSGLP